MTQKQFRDKVIDARNNYRKLDERMLFNDEWELLDDVNNAIKEYTKLYNEYKKKFNKKISF
jgi:hypothetical protein